MKKIVRLTEGQLYNIVRQVLINEMGRRPNTKEDNEKTYRRKLLEYFRDILSRKYFLPEFMGLHTDAMSAEPECYDIPRSTTLWDIFSACIDNDKERRKEVMGAYTSKTVADVLRLLSRFLHLPTNTIRTLWYADVDAFFKEVKSHNYSINKRRDRDEGLIW